MTTCIICGKQLKEEDKKVKEYGIYDTCKECALIYHGINI